MSEHTKEPWRLGKLTPPRDYKSVLETVGPHQVVVDTENGPYVLADCNINFKDDALANARRIVACVNACAGFDNEVLENIVALGDTLRGRFEARAAAEKQRDELLARFQWTALSVRMPNPEEHARVLIYTDGHDFNGEQFFDVAAESLNECLYSDIEDQPEVSKHATHWIPLPTPAAIASVKGGAAESEGSEL